MFNGLLKSPSGSSRPGRNRQCSSSGSGGGNRTSNNIMYRSKWVLAAFVLRRPGWDSLPGEGGAIPFTARSNPNDDAKETVPGGYSQTRLPTVGWWGSASCKKAKKRTRYESETSSEEKHTILTMRNWPYVCVCGLSVAFYCLF